MAREVAFPFLNGASLSLFLSLYKSFFDVSLERLRFSREAMLYPGLFPLSMWDELNGDIFLAKSFDLSIFYGAI